MKLTQLSEVERMAPLSINKDRLVEGCATVEGEVGDDSEWEDPNDKGMHI